MYILLEALNGVFPMKLSHKTLGQPQKAVETKALCDVRHLAIRSLNRLTWKVVGLPTEVLCLPPCMQEQLRQLVTSKW